MSVNSLNSTSSLRSERLLEKYNNNNYRLKVLDVHAYNPIPHKENPNVAKPKPKKYVKPTYTRGHLESISETNDFQLVRKDIEKGDKRNKGKAEIDGNKGKKKKRKRPNKDPNVTYAPPDGGWGWIVCAACFVFSILLASMETVFGILFSGFLRDLQASSAVIAWIFNAHSFFFNISTLLSGTLCSQFGWRVTAVLGGFMAFLSIILTIFASSPFHIFITISLLNGSGAGIGFSAALFCLPCYFDSKRGLATAAITMGVGAGQLIMPLFVRYLLEEEGFLSTCLITAGLILNTCAAGLVFHPVEWHSKKVVKDEEGGNQEEKVGLKDQNTFFRRASSFTRTGSFHTGSASNIHFTTSTMTMSAINLSVLSLKNRSSDKNSSEEKSGICNSFRMIGKSLWESLKILRYWKSIFISVASSFVCVGYINFLMMVPFVLQHRGFTLAQSSNCLAMASGFNMTLRGVMSIASDLPRFNKRFVYMTGVLILTVCTCMFTIPMNITQILVLMGFWGTGLGMSMGLYVLIMIEYIGLDHYPQLYGTSSFSISLTMILMGPIIGLIRDVSGNYAYSLWFLGSLMAISLVIWALMPLAIRWDKNKVEDAKIQDTECNDTKSSPINA